MTDDADQRQHNLEQRADNVGQHADNAGQHADNIQQGTDDEQYVRVQRWVVRVAEYLLILLAMGAASSILLLAFWMIALDHATKEIKQDQVWNRKIVEANQKLILDNQDKIIKITEEAEILHAAAKAKQE